MMSVLSLNEPFTKIVAFASSIDQDHTAQNMQPDLISMLEAFEYLHLRPIGLEESYFCFESY